MNSSPRDVNAELIQWAIWSKTDNGPAIGFPTMTPTRRMSGAPLDWEHDINHVPIPLTMNDDQALQLDKTIAGLDLDLRTAIYLFYQKNYPILKIAKAMRTNRDKAAELLRTARRIIDHVSRSSNSGQLRHAIG